MKRFMCVMAALCLAAPASASVQTGIFEADMPEARVVTATDAPRFACQALEGLIRDVLYLRTAGIEESTMKALLVSQMARLAPQTQHGPISPGTRAFVLDADTVLRATRRMTPEEAASPAGAEATLAAVGDGSEIVALLAGSPTACA